MSVIVKSKQFYALGWFYHNLNRYAHSTIPSVRIRILDTIAVLERRHASRSRRAGVWRRVERAPLPSNAKEWAKLGKEWAKLASEFTTAIKWDGTSGRCFNRTKSKVSIGRGRLIRGLPRDGVFLTGVDYHN